MRRSLALPIAGGITILAFVTSVAGHYSPNDWLWGPASPGLIKYGFGFVVLFYIAFGMFVMFMRYREASGYHVQLPLYRLTDDGEVIPVSRPRQRQQGPPTQPIPIAPDEVGAVND